MTKDQFKDLGYTEKERYGRSQAIKALENYDEHYVTHITEMPIDSHYDLEFDVDDIPYIAEVKKRWCKSTTYNNAYLEQLKLNYINDTTPEGFHKAYICVYDDCTLIWNLDNINPDNYEWRTMAKNNIGGNDGEKVMKKVIELPINKGKKL